MYKIAVIGDKKSIMLFSLSGFLTFIAEDKEATLKILKEITQNNNFGIIYITEKLFLISGNEIQKYSSYLTLIPGIDGNNDIGKQSLDLAVKKAMGGIK